MCQDLQGCDKKNIRKPRLSSSVQQPDQKEDSEDNILKSVKKKQLRKQRHTMRKVVRLAKKQPGMSRRKKMSWKALRGHFQPPEAKRNNRESRHG